MDKKEFYSEQGYIIVKNVIPHKIIDNYKKYWISIHAPKYEGTVESMINKMGWKESNPFMAHEEILDLMCHESIYQVFEDVGLQKMALHLTFTPWYSTEKTWHHDMSISDSLSAENYAGVWVALNDIHPESGPFSYIPKSNHWDFDYSIYRTLNPNEIVAHISREMITRKTKPEVFLAEKGDIILWQGHTVHRGLNPTNPNLPREAIIGHYSSGVKGKGVDQVTSFNPHLSGFYVRHRNEVRDLYDTDEYGNMIKRDALGNVLKQK